MMDNYGLQNSKFVELVDNWLTCDNQYSLYDLANELAEILTGYWSGSDYFDFEFRSTYKKDNSQEWYELESYAKDEFSNKYTEKLNSYDAKKWFMRLQSGHKLYDQFKNYLTRNNFKMSHDDFYEFTLILLNNKKFKEKLANIISEPY